MTIVRPTGLVGWVGAVTYAVAGTMLFACTYAGGRPTADPVASGAAPTSDRWTPSVAADATIEPSPPDESIAMSPAPTPTAAWKPAGREEAQAVLDNWADILSERGPHPIVLTGSVTRGGGWDRGDQKVAFYCGRLEVVGDLPGQPPPGEVVWYDDWTQTVSLLSAEEAVEQIAQDADSVCDDERPLQVTGARLTTHEVATSAGPATVPVWQFQFVDRDKPNVPIIHVALDPSEYLALENWPDQGAGAEWGAGRPGSSAVTIAFIGPGPVEKKGWCGAEFSGEAVESATGVVVVVHALPNPATPPPVPSGAVLGCTLEGYTRTVTVSLDAPLGARTVLDLHSGRPLPLYPEPPDGYPRTW